LKTTAGLTPSYRADIDGLRSIAILPVLLFHAGLACPGGFVGVDVFFVISGYLITKIIVREMGQGKFTLLGFYERRIRRIFPALFAMFTATALAGIYFLSPNELKDLGKTLLASSVFSSNILFYGRAGYFAGDSEAIPLLHTWSLSVEEQFYVFWPLLLLVLAKHPHHWKLVATCGIVIGSIALSASLVVSNSNAAFYLLPSRAWELGLGALLALPQVREWCSRASPAVASVASLIGIAAILIAATTFTTHTPFPGFAAALPCLGAALTLAAGEQGKSIGGTLLSWRPLVWIGQASYSLYLWHWPILVLAGLLFHQRLGIVERAALLAATFLVAWMSLRFVERPFRAPPAERHTVRWVGGGLAASIAFAIAAGLLVMSDGVPSRGEDVGSWLKSAQQEASAFQSSPCLARGAQLAPVEACALGFRSKDRVILYGDSHAAQYAPMLDSVGRQLGVGVQQITRAGCPPLPTLEYPPGGIRDTCHAFNARAVDALSNGSVVVVAARWEAMIAGELLLKHGPSSADALQASLRSLLLTLTSRGQKVLLIGYTPVLPYDGSACVSRARFHKWSESACIPSPAEREELSKINDRVKIVLETAAQNMPGVYALHPYESLCGDGYCAPVRGNAAIYMDREHLSAFGANTAGAALRDALADLLARPDAARAQ
jgi:peptidoglycan/LPS O-acetylase OafA/YrhL